MSALNQKIDRPIWKKEENEIDNADNYMNDETFLTYVLMSFPQEEYHTMILVLEDKLRKRTLTIEEAERFF